MSDELTLKAISAYNGNLHNGMTAALEAVVAMVLEEAAKCADRYEIPMCETSASHIAAAIRALKDQTTT